ncbi:MAG: hypothetical protein AB7K71_27800 [Polyangiaceae bacterium]
MRRLLLGLCLASLTACRDVPPNARTRVEPVGGVLDKSPPSASSASSTPLASAATASADVVPAPPPPPPTSPSDAELEETREALRSDLGDSIHLSTLRGTFVVAAPRAMSKATFAQSQKFVERVLDAYLNQRFDRLPARAVKVLLFPDARSYEAYCLSHYGEPPSTPYGFYRPDERQITMNLGPGVGTLTHELVHPILDADFPAAPEWLNEGIASLFEYPVVPRKGEIHGATNWRLPRLTRAIRSQSERSEATLSRLFQLDDSQFRGASEDLYYALARYFCQWLDGRGQLWAFYRLWRDQHAKDPSGITSFHQVTGKAPGDFDRDFQRWALSL